MEIAPGVDAKQWTKLDLSKGDSTAWKKAIEILRKRIEERYLEPVDRLIESEESRPPQRRRYGFVVLAIDCLLIETLQAFFEGKIDTKRDSGPMFVKFLTSRELFKTDFSKDLAGRFYAQIRCGILHQGETRKARLSSVGKLIRSNGDEMVLNRTEFHSRLKREFEAYLNGLSEGTDAKLRSNLRKKMDHICTN